MGEPRGGDFWGAAQGNTLKPPRGRAGRTPGAPGLGCPLRRGGLEKQPRGRALPKHPPHRAGAPSGAGRAPAVGRAPPAALGAGTHTHTHTNTPPSSTASPFPPPVLPQTTAKMLLLLLGIIVLHVTVLVLLFVSTIVSVSTAAPRALAWHGRVTPRYFYLWLIFQPGF